ncbi:uncharacterized protein [Aristolochia californica]|uniref:uncharacterized protein n=1 Tax=Aristolochia californica TaxID=171875 RepID=UPI0035DFCCE0
MVLTPFRQKIKVLQSDIAKEYTSKDLDSFCQENGIIHQTSCAYTCQQNGIAKRKNHHILEVARGLLYAMKVPCFYWPNSSAINVLSIFPPQDTVNLIQNLSSVSFQDTIVHKRVMFISRTRFSSTSCALCYRNYYAPETMVDTTPAEFSDPTEVSPSSLVIFGPQYDTRPIAIRKEPRSCTMPSTSHPRTNFLSHHHLSPVCCPFLSAISSIPIPQFYQKALKHPGWKAVMDEEMQALYENQT